MSVGIVTEQSRTFDSGIRLDSGRILAPITLVYETYGALNASASNAILVEHAWTGNAHLAGKLSEDDTSSMVNLSRSQTSRTPRVKPCINTWKGNIRL